jgi:hypothetical protein
MWKVKKINKMETIKKNSDDIVNLVVARLEAMPPNAEISIGGGGDYTVSQLIDSVKKQDEVGKQMIDVQLNYLRSFAEKVST